MAFDAFISYSHTDKAIADAACATLENAGTRCWIAPRDVPPGSQWAAAIIGAIDHCRVMVLIFSSQANISNQIHREMERAVSKGIPIIPLRIEDVEPTNSMEYFLGAIHWLDALTPPLEQHLERLAETVKSCLDFNQNGGTSTRSDTAQLAASSPNAISEIQAPPVGMHSNQSSRQDSAQLHKPAGHRWAMLGALCLLIAACAGTALFYLKYLPDTESQQQKVMQARDGLYSGEVCYGPGRDDPARCYTQRAIVSQGNISGNWAGRNPGATVTLSGVVSASGDLTMEMHSDLADGTPEAAADLSGTLRDGRLDAIGMFRTGRSVSINWRRN